MGTIMAVFEKATIIASQEPALAYQRMPTMEVPCCNVTYT